MRATIIALLFATAAGAQVEQEDAAHRADRLRTQQLNRQAAVAPASRDRANAASRRAYEAAQARYERARAIWARRVAACRAGDVSACTD